MPLPSAPVPTAATGVGDRPNSVAAVRPSSIVIERVQPMLDCGRYPVKREVGDRLEVSADIFKDGHDKLAAVVRYRKAADPADDPECWFEIEMRHLDNDRWAAAVPLTENTRYAYLVQAFPDRFASWRDEVQKKVAAGVDVASELLEGRRLVEDAAGRALIEDMPLFESYLAAAASAPDQDSCASMLLADELAEAMRRNRSRADAAASPELEVIVDRVAARYAAWYEIFPRSTGAEPGQSATFKDVERHLPRIQAMGFDVLYFPPINPIGAVNRKGKNNSVTSRPGDPGSPYAIGSAEGGHDALEPQLGAFDDFRHLVAAAADHGLEIALDFAIQCAPDHPWVTDHPEWFHIRPDGTIKYAENPPKKYEDIYPINFNSSAWQGLWQEMKRIILCWVDHGVRIFRVDNPHTKPTVFWEWLIAEVHREHPEVIFLSEAFTRPKVMKSLAKAGFTQSYTYFTWRNFKRELIDYLEELTQGEPKEYMRGNFFVNTPDILPYILQEGGRPAFKLRLALAATLSSVYGLYSGYELCENAANPGKEEYLNSEKYEYKVWDWDRPGNIVDYVTFVNRIRREHPALHEYDNLRFHPADDDNVVCYSKATPDNSDIVVAVINLDPFSPHECQYHLPIGDWDIAPDEQYRAVDLLTDRHLIWTGSTQWTRLDPHDEPARFFAISRFEHVSYKEPCY